jgi:hypothetical protein
MPVPEVVKKVEPVEGGYDWPLGDRRIRVRNLLTDIAGEVLNWNGQDGPFKLEDLPNIENLETVAQTLFGLSYEQAIKKAEQSWKPYLSDNGRDDARRLVISGGTDKISTRDGELGFLEKSGNVIGINAAIESRELALLVSGDIAFGNSKAWQEVAEHKHGVKTHTVGEGHLNYNSHKLLQKALRCAKEDMPSDRELQIMVSEIAYDPDIVVQLYASDDENNLFLMYLRDRVNNLRESIGKPPIEKIKVDANSPEVTKRLMSKGYLYPVPSEVINLNNREDNYDSWLELEGKYSPIEIELGNAIPRMPGYHIPWLKDKQQFRNEVQTSINLLKSRWGVKTAFFKITEGSDGAGSIKVDISNGENIAELSEKLYAEGSSWVVEPFVEYDNMVVEGKGIKQERRVAPSVHIRGGKPYKTQLGQLFIRDESGDTTEWGGHLYAPEDYVKNQFEKGEKVLGMNEQEYFSGIDAISQIAKQFEDQGLSRGGVDIAVGTIDTKWGKKRVNALQDMNIRTNGGDTARGFGKLLETELKIDKPFATLVIKPVVGVGYNDIDMALRDVAQKLGIVRKHIRLITAVAPGWGMFGVIGDSPESATISGIHIQETLKEKGLIR